MRGILLAIAISLAACAPSALAQEQDPVAPITAFHAALMANHPEAAAAELGPTFFIADESTAPREERVRAHMYLSGERLSGWPARYLEQVGPYQNAFTVVSVNVRGDAAVVITRDSGSNAFRPWRDEELTWYLGREAGRWRILGYVIRDFQPPQ